MQTVLLPNERDYDTIRTKKTGLPLHGVQFHPESVLTEGGHRLFANWLQVCGAHDAVERSAGLHPLVRL